MSIYLQKIDLLLNNFRIHKINIIDLYFTNVNKIIDLLFDLLEINNIPINVSITSIDHKQLKGFFFIIK